MSFECSCESCVSGCRVKPGWFMPGEIEPLAANMGLSVQELFDARLAVDQSGETLALSPAVVGHKPGTEFDAISLGVCVFLKDGRCEIHALGKPHECAEATHFRGANHLEIAAAWVPHQGRIRELLDGHRGIAGR